MQETYVPDPVFELEKLTKTVNDLAGSKSRGVLKRYPTLFMLLTALGFSAVIHGFENLFDNIELFAKNPDYLLLFGLMVLIFTGSLFKKLSK